MKRRVGARCSVDLRGRARVASRLKSIPPKGFNPPDARRVLEINDEAKEIVQELGAAINSAVERSAEVAEAIERLREAGYELELTLRLEIGLRENEDAPPRESSAELELTDEDRRTLRSMKIRLDDAD
jgi:flagellar biosynthesis/type III secretory pathway protein FliH